jgi:hypothetical protein
VDRNSTPRAALPRRAASRLDGLCECGAWLLPLLMGVWWAGGAPTWRDDFAIVRDLGFVPVGTEGLLSTVLAQVSTLAPVGGRLFRACLVGVIALALCSRLLFARLRDLLDAEAPFGPNPFLALLATQLWALDLVTQREAAVVASPALALLLILVGLRVSEAWMGDARSWPLAGMLLALAAAESHAAGLILLLLFVARWTAERGRPSAAAVRGFAAGLLSAAGVCVGARALRTLSPQSGLDLGVATPYRLDDAATGAPVRGVIDVAERVLAFWLERLGAPTLLLAAAGAAWCLYRPALRRAVVPWLVLTAAAGVVPLAPRLGAPLASPLFAFIASLALLAFVALALQALVRVLWFAGVPFARPAAVLSLTFAITLLLSRLDEARPAIASGLGAELWTEEAFGKLPPRSLALVRSASLAYRLLSARILRGERADVIIVPSALLSQGSLTQQLSSAAPELAPLLRQLAVNGYADEYSLCGLADARPLFVELDPSWDVRLLEHLRPEAIWLGFLPHALGAAERRAGLERNREALQRTLAPLAAGGQLDDVTRHTLSDLVGQQALALAAVGDRASAQHALRMLRRLVRDDRLAAELGARLSTSERGRLSVRDLVY